MQKILEFYKQPSRLTTSNKYSHLIEPLPDDVKSLVHVIHGIALHEYLAFAYGIAIPDARRGESHVRYLEPMLDCLMAQDDAPLNEARPPEKRLFGVCRHFTLLLVALLRAKGIPARGRCGFATYFNPGTYEDHWLCEYWDHTQDRWVPVDSQLDEIQRKVLNIDFNPLDVPHDRFLVAGEAWTRCRSGQDDAAKYGVFKGDLRGLWFIAGDIVRDVAALNSMEMLAWDVWGIMPHPDAIISDDDLAFFDHLAVLTQDPDANFDILRNLYQNDDRLHVPRVLFNAILNRTETI